MSVHTVAQEDAPASATQTLEKSLRSSDSVEYTMYCATMDMPVMHVVLHGDGGSYFGPVIEFADMTEQQLREYEAELLLHEAFVTKEIGRARRSIEAVRSQREAVA